MEIDKTKVKTLANDDQSEMDRANDRVDAEMKLLESEAKEMVAQGLQDEKIADEAKQLRREAESDQRRIEGDRKD
jgi:hypothetical protein